MCNWPPQRSCPETWLCHRDLSAAVVAWTLLSLLAPIYQENSPHWTRKTTEVLLVQRGLFVLCAADERISSCPHLGTSHPQGSARTPSSSGRALPPCNTIPRTRDALRFKSSRKARIPVASLVVTWLPALISNATNLPPSSKMKSTSCPARSRQKCNLRCCGSRARHVSRVWNRVCSNQNPASMRVLTSADDLIPASQAARPQSVQSSFGALTSAVEGFVDSGRMRVIRQPVSNKFKYRCVVG